MPTTLHVAMEQAPLTLNPRLALDAIGQRVGSLLFQALTRLDHQLEPKPDGAESWRQSADGKSVFFHIRKDSGKSVLDWAQCFENYKNPAAPLKASPLAASFPNWVKTIAHPDRNELELQLSKPDPYLARNLSLIRFFRVDQEPPCREKKGGKWEFSGPYRAKQWSESPQIEIELEPRSSKTRPNVTIHFVRDENTRTLRLIRGDLDFVINSVSLAKTRWIQKNQKSLSVLERPGTTVQYLAFCLKDPIIGNLRVRQALAHAIPRDLIVKNKLFGFGQVADSFLSPELGESVRSEPLRYDPELSKQLLEEAGFKPDADGTRLRIKYRTTPVREGKETALMLREVFGRVGVRVDLDVVEPSVFFLGIKQGKCQLYSSRWIGVSDASIYLRALGSSQLLNRVKYSNPKTDQILDRLGSEPDLAKRKPMVEQLQSTLIQDLPYYPLWFWSNAVVIKSELASRVDPNRISLSGALDVILDQLQ